MRRLVIPTHIKLQIVEMYKAGKNSNYISNKFNISVGKVFCILKESNVRVRTKSEVKFKDARYVDNHGYVIVTAMGDDRKYLTNKDRNRISEHRLVMSRHLGRKLRIHETVHHINGDRQDNEINNLELWSTNQPYGQRVKDKIKWAKQILREYKDLSDEL